MRTLCCLVIVAACGGSKSSEPGDCTAFEAGYRRHLTPLFEPEAREPGTRIMVTACKEVPFSRDVTSCVASAADRAEAHACFAKLTERENDAVQALRDKLAPPADAAGPAAAAAFALAPPLPPGPAYVANDTGVWKIGLDGAFSKVAGGEYWWFATAGDGTIFALEGLDAARTSVARIVDGNLQPLPTIGVHEAFGGLDTHGETVAVGLGNDVYVLDGASAKKWRAQPIGDYVRSVAFDAKGTLWVSTLKGAFSVDATGAHPLALPKEIDAFASISGLRHLGDDVLLLTGEGAVVVDAAGAKLRAPSAKVAFPGSDARNGLLVIPDNSIGDHWGTLALWRATGATKSLPLHRDISSVVVDGRGRIWAMVERELIVADAATGEVTTYPQDAYPQLPSVLALEPQMFLAVAGGGPALPPVPPTRVTKHVKGKLVVDDAPIAGGTVVVCPSMSLVWTPSATDDSPCVRNKLVFKTVTTADGGFAFDALPLGSYDLAYYQGPKWVQAPGGALSNLRAGVDNNVGTLRFSTSP